jgi:hypothetical protein
MEFQVHIEGWQLKRDKLPGMKVGNSKEETGRWICRLYEMWAVLASWFDIPVGLGYTFVMFYVPC